MNDIRAIILAAGRGRRMKASTDDRPKCLMKIRGKTLLEWQLATLKAAGVREIAIVTGYKREMLVSSEITEFHNSRWAVTNMVSSLECAAMWLQEHVCIVSYSDIFYEAIAVKSLMESTAMLAITYDLNWLELWKMRFGDPLIDAETFRVGSDGWLSEIGNKPRSIDEVQGQYMGLLRSTPQAWNEVMRIRQSLTKQEQDQIHMTGMLQKIIVTNRVRVYAIPYDCEWGEVDTVDDLSLYQDGH